MKLIELTKICTKCGKRKSFKNFHKKKNGCFGVRSICGVCIKIWRENNKEKIKKWYKLNYLKNKEKIKKKSSEYRLANKEKVKNRQKSIYVANCVRINIKRKKLYQINKDEKNLKQRLYRKSNPKLMLALNFSNAIKASLKRGSGKNGKSWRNIVPYTLDDLIKHLKKTLPVGYIWDNYINGKTDLSIDHIVPISVHNFTSYNHLDFQRCWALKNLRLLSLKENISKGAKLEKPFQPSLLL